jgi:hypothetical protein
MDFFENPPFWLSAVMWMLAVAGGALGLFFGGWKIFTTKTVPQVLAEQGWVRLSTMRLSTVFQGLGLVLFGAVPLVLLVSNIVLYRSSLYRLMAGFSEPITIGPYAGENATILMMIPMTLINSGAPTPVTWEAHFKRKDGNYEQLELINSFKGNGLKSKIFPSITTDDLIQLKTIRPVRQDSAISGFLIGRLPRGLSVEAAQGGSILVRYRDESGTTYEVMRLDQPLVGADPPPIDRAALKTTYPLGYVIFEVGKAPEEVFPLERDGLKDLDFDLREVRLTELPENKVQLTLPPISRNGQKLIGQTEVTMPRYVSGFSGGASVDDLAIGAEIISIRDGRIVFALGFFRVPLPPRVNK